MTAQTPAPPSKTAGASLPRPRRSAIIPPTATLALWRLRQSWRLLLITELGMVAAVLLICVVPLFSQVSISGGLRAALAASTGSRDIGVTAAISDMTQASAKQLKPQVDAMIRARVGPYLSGVPVFSITSLPMVIYKTQAEAKAGGEAAPNGPGLLLVGRDLGEVSSQAQLTAGRLPLATSSQMEVALTGDVADALQLSLGQTFYVSFRFGPPSIPAVAIPIKVVGLFNAVGGADVYAGQAGQSQGNFVKFGFGGAAPYPGLVSNDAMLSVMGPAILAGVSGSGTGIGYGRGGPLAGWLNWNYPLAVDRITGSDLGALADARNRIQIDLNNQLNGSSGIQFFQTYGALDIVNDYNGRVVASQVIVIVLLLQVMGLILLFVSVMAGILVERQSEAIALLRSRGAYRRQIFGALTLHGLGMSLLALIVGPLVAIPLVRLVAQALLSSAGQQGLSVLDGNPLTVAWTVRWYAFAAIIGAGLAILIAIWRAANRNVLALRRESARTTTRPLWQRLHLDLVFAVIAATGYGLYLFVLDKVGIYAARALSVMALIAPLFLLLAGALLFLRFFPLALRGVARLATRRSGATSMLALSQMARAPRDFSRMLLQLALSTAFMVFALVFIASQLAHVGETVNFRTVGDFQGTLSATVTAPATTGAAAPTPSAIAARYAAIPGVRAASVGLLATSELSSSQVTVTAVAVDPTSFAQTALWSTQYSSQSLDALMVQLRDARVSALASGVIPVVVDDALWQNLHLQENGKFSLAYQDRNSQINFIAVAHIAHIPPVLDEAGSFYGPNGASGGFLADYETFTTIYKQDLKATSSGPAPTTLWLRTDDDPGSLATVRAALNGGGLAVTNMADRRQQQGDIINNPLQLNIIGTLGLGAAVALVLALIGVLTASWINANSRLTSFAVLRALGTTPRQVLNMLLWEQGIVYVSALVIGALLGFVLSTATLPALVFTSLVANISTSNGPQLDVPPAHVILPPEWLGIAFGTLAVICAVAILITTVSVSRASLSESLRLNQD